MGKRGPAKTPTAVLARRGAWRAKERDDEPQADGSPLPPAWLSGVPADMWSLLIEQLGAMGVLGLIDSNALARYCQLYTRWRECEDFIESKGMTTDDGEKEYPQVARSARLADQLLKLEQQFGMTPSARASMSTQTKKPAKDKDGKGRFFKPKLTG